MVNPNQIEGGSKVFAIEDANARSPEFLEQMEKEKEGFKIHYYLWLSRFYIMTAIISMLVLISSSLALFKLAPMVTVEPFLIIRQDESQEIVREEPITSDMSSKDKLMETFIRQYVISRNTIINDPMEMRSRWNRGGMVNFLSSPEVFDAFNRSTQANWENIFKQALVREVEIISIGKQGGKKSPVWKVDFKTYDLYDEQGKNQAQKESTLRVRYWTASVTAYFIKERQFMGRRLLNPLGFTVTRYSQTEVEIF